MVLHSAKTIRGRQNETNGNCQSSKLYHRTQILPKITFATPKFCRILYALFSPVFSQRPLHTRAGMCEGDDGEEWPLSVAEALEREREHACTM